MACSCSDRKTVETRREKAAKRQKAIARDRVARREERRKALAAK